MLIEPRRLRHNVWIYQRLILTQLRTMVEYRGDFWIGIVGAVLMHGAGLVFIAAFFGRIPAVGGWSAWEVALLYGLVMVPNGLREMWTDGVWSLRAQLNRGEFDRLLVRPLSPALQLAAGIASVHGVGNFLLGLVVLVTAAGRVGVEWTVGRVAWLLLTLACGFVIVVSIAFLANMIGFWEPGTQSGFPFFIANSAEFAKFPLDLYGWGLRALITAVLPFGFVSYYPALVLLDKESDLRWLGYLTPAVPVVVVAVTARIWRAGLGRYQGTGH
jgi:ABC-2 type transport system permease protein